MRRSLFQEALDKFARVRRVTNTGTKGSPSSGHLSDRTAIDGSPEYGMFGQRLFGKTDNAGTSRAESFRESSPAGRLFGASNTVAPSRGEFNETESQRSSTKADLERQFLGPFTKENDLASAKPIDQPRSDPAAMIVILQRVRPRPTPKDHTQKYCLAPGCPIAYPRSDSPATIGIVQRARTRRGASSGEQPRGICRTPGLSGKTGQANRLNQEAHTVN